MKNKFFLLVFTLNIWTILNIFAIDKLPSAAGSKNNLKKANVNFFEGNFKAALAKAKEEQKMIFIDCYTSWCRPCKLMDSILESDPKLSNFLNENFVCLSINMERGEGPRLKRKYPLGTYPTLLFIKNNGVLKNKFIGLPEYGAAEILNFAKLASRKY